LKLDADTLLTVPDDPPAAGPDRAFDPPPPNPERRGELLADALCGALEGDAAVACEDVLAHPVTPIAGTISAAATIHPFLLFGRNRRSLDRRVALVSGSVVWS
jgi:hypothetical protein